MATAASGACTAEASGTVPRPAAGFAVPAGETSGVTPENVPVVTEQQQADRIKTMVTRYLACDPTVADVQLFRLVDERYRNGRDENGRKRYYADCVRAD